MPTQIRFHGVAAYELISSDGRHVLIDPYLDENPGATVKSDQLERVDLILISHAALDHLGDAEKIARRTGAPVVCGGDVKNYLTMKGLPGPQIQAIVWGIAIEVAGFWVQPVECHHWSQIKLPNGQYATGVPMGFVIELDPGVRFYHYGDTGIFSDLKLIGELYRPTIGALGITQPAEILHTVEGPARLLTGEMSAREGALAAEWLGLQIALPCHYINPNNDDVREFVQRLDESRARNGHGPRAVVLKPGETFTIDGAMDETLHIRD
ncbi:MAG TPA: MBL fold metallo-hydrolase [Anaerolineae bacterium]|nr:MBL fold metallo-hydrolase [Anaerolineae bacterium]